MQPLAHMFSRYRVRAPIGLALVLMSVSGTVRAADDAALVASINEYRQSRPHCQGKQAEALGPLAPNARLARTQVRSGEQLQAALQQAGYQHAAVQVLSVTGPASPAAAMGAISQRYCATLLDPQFAEIGVLRAGNTWQVILARPLLSSAMGDWQAAGKEILEQVNQARASARRCGDQAFDPAPPVSWNATLGQTALGHSRDMAQRNYFSHTDKAGNLAGVRATRAGYQWRSIGENLAAGQGSAEQAVSGWLASPTHCPNIMNPDFTEMGAAYAVNPQSDAGIYWTQVFGTPQ